MIVATAFPTPRRSKDPLVGELKVACKPWSPPTVTEIRFDELPVELRMLALGLPLPEPTLQT